MDKRWKIIIHCLKDSSLNIEDKERLKAKGWKANTNYKKSGVTTLISDTLNIKGHYLKWTEIFHNEKILNSIWEFKNF